MTRRLVQRSLGSSVASVGLEQVVFLMELTTEEDTGQSGCCSPGGEPGWVADARPLRWFRKEEKQEREIRSDRDDAGEVVAECTSGSEGTPNEGVRKPTSSTTDRGERERGVDVVAILDLPSAARKCDNPDGDHAREQ
jgi:hypothetical protein